MSVRRSRILWLFGVLALTSGCGASRQAPSPFEGGGGTGATGADEPIRVEVQNLNFNDITIWAMRQGQRVRLGRVTGKTDTSFQVNWNPAIPISFAIDVTGGRSCGTSRVGVERNARVWVTVPSNVGSQPCRVGRR